ncbi:Protein YLS3 [Glycine soja]|uniref:Protein YLS3 n=1 Tax=Glycine soja TaxID=3848 RepID=A0A445GKG6_GLYSO|nr:Protein YLS3 [Glycine soja]
MSFLIFSAQLTGFSLGDFPFRYLGVPLLSSRLNVCHYAPLLSKITGLIQGWSKKSLSYAGKLELIRAVIQGIVNFWMGIFPLPQSVLDRINASCCNFLWGKADIGKNKPLVAWSVVCSPKKEGGLGLFNLKDWNLALLSRILWDFHCKKDYLWVRWVHHYYFRGSDVWNYNTYSSDSVLIKKIIQIRDFIISKELSTEEAKKRIQSWSTNEQLLVGKVYEYIRGLKPIVSWCFVIWNPATPPKMSFILWLAKRNRLLTHDKVTFLNKGSLCPLCSNEPESNAHLFFSCRKSLQVWAHIRDLAPFCRRFTSLQRITNSLIRGRSTSGAGLLLREKMISHVSTSDETLDAIHCCSGLTQAMKTNKKCVCLILKDRDDPDLGLKINMTIAVGLPSLFKTPDNLSQCSALLHLDPKSPEAQAFNQIGQKSNGGSISPSPTTSAEGSSQNGRNQGTDETATAKKNSASYIGKRLLESLVAVAGLLIWLS